MAGCLTTRSKDAAIVQGEKEEQKQREKGNGGIDPFYARNAKTAPMRGAKMPAATADAPEVVAPVLDGEDADEPEEPDVFEEVGVVDVGLEPPAVLEPDEPPDAVVLLPPDPPLTDSVELAQDVLPVSIVNVPEAALFPCESLIAK